MDGAGLPHANETSTRTTLGGLRELGGLVLWAVLLAAPWCVHLLAVTSDALPAEAFWVSAPMSLLATGVWHWVYGSPTRNRDGELGLEANATVALWGSAGWLNIQTLTALGLFIYQGEGSLRLWSFALWVLMATALLVTMLTRQLRSGSSS